MTKFLFRDDDARSSNALKIDGIALPPTNSLKVQYYDIQINSYRDVTPEALLHKETIAKDKVKLVCSWGYLSSTEVKKILNACNQNEFHECTFWNPLTDKFSTMQIYRGDREVEVYRMIEQEDGSYMYDAKSLTVNFIMQ